MIKPVKIILLLLLLTCTAKAQENIEAQKFLLGVFKDNTAKEVFIYNDKASTSFFDDVTKVLKQDTLRGVPFGMGAGIKNLEYVVLSEAERKYVFKCLDKQKTKVWASGLLPNSKIISGDTITNVFKDRRKSWFYFYEHFGSGFHSFTEPIFLRNNSLCFFYSDYSCGDLCGAGDLSIYREKDGVWKKIITLYAWIS